MAGKTDIPKSFKCDDDFNAWIGEQLTNLDCGLSQLIRTSLILAVPILQEYPELIDSLSIPRGSR